MGIVAPASGEGIYHAMLGGRLAAEAVEAMCTAVSVRWLKLAWKRFMRDHVRVFFILGIMRHFWYLSDNRRKGFVKMCNDRDVRRLTWDAYMNETLVRADPMVHMLILVNDMAHLCDVARV